MLNQICVQKIAPRVIPGERLFIYDGILIRSSSQPVIIMLAERLRHVGIIDNPGEQMLFKPRPDQNPPPIARDEKR